MNAPARTRLAASAIACALTLSGLAGCGTDDTRADDTSPADSSPTSSATSSDGAATIGPSPTENSPTSEGAVTVPLYFVGDTPQGPRLFREFRAVPADNPLEEAAALVTAGDTLDPDYRTLFPGGAFGEITHADGRFAVQLRDDAWNTPADGMSESEAKLAVQQLVYTIQGVEQSRDPVTFYLGDRPGLIFGIDSADGITNAPELDVLAFVNVTSPEEGSTVSGTFTANGLASSFEATVPWEIRQGGAVVKHGFSTAEGWMDKLYPWETEIDLSDLAPGDYSFVAMTDDPSDGEGGGPTEDSKTITVE